MTSVWYLELTKNWGPEFDIQNPGKNSGTHSKSQCSEVETWIPGTCRASEPNLISEFSTKRIPVSKDKVDGF